MPSHRPVFHLPSHPAAPAAVTAPVASSASIARDIKARFWDRIARQYAADAIADMPGYEATLRRVQALLSPAHDVLEIGCGTGSTALRLAPHVKHLLATDISSEMVAIARERLAAQPTQHLHFAVADADQPEFGHAAWDAVLAFNVLHLVGDLDRAVQVAVQGLKPGGLFVSKTICLHEMNPLIAHLALPMMRAIGKAPHVLCLDAKDLQQAMVRHGLEIEAVERHGTQGRDARVFIVARKLSHRRVDGGRMRAWSVEGTLPDADAHAGWPR